MTTNQIAGFYFPTAILCVDDREDYLESLKTLLDPMIFSRFYTQPKEALAYLQNDYASTIFTQHWISHLSEQSVEHTYSDNHAFVDINLSAIHKEIYSSTRFQEVSVVVIDYAMPIMNGLEFCKQLKNSPKNNAIKILMLTGQADHALGVRALNEGIIDYFITKDSNPKDSDPKDSSHGFKQNLNSAIQYMQLQYFVHFSKPLIHNLIANPHCGLANADYLDLFEKIKAENKIMEYYLITDMGSFLMFDFEGNPFWLIIKNEKDMESSYQCLMDNDLPDEIIQSVKNREKLLFFFSDQDKIMASNTEWLHYLHPAKKLESKNGVYYYSFIQGKSVYGIDLKKIVPYRKFLENR